MQAVLEHLTPTDEIMLVKCGQSNALPYGDRDSEGLVAAPHLALSPAGLDLTILAITSIDGGEHGAAGTQSIVTVAEALTARYWINGEIRLVAHDYGEQAPICLRRGSARVLDNTAGAVLAGVLFDLDADRVLWAAHGRPNGSQVTFDTTGALPGLTAGQIYYVIDATPNTFRVSINPWGTAAALSGGSGTHTARARPCLTVSWTSPFQAPQAGITFSAPGIVNQVGHNYPNGSTVSFFGAIPPELTEGQDYYMVALTADTYAIALTRGGALLAFSDASSIPLVARPNLMVDVAGYVHLHDRFASYPNILVVTPYQPIEPGDYPAGAPVVPGVTLPSDVTTYEDLALALPFAWNEGIDGYGAVGTVTVSGLVMTLVGQTIQPDIFVGAALRVGGAKAMVTANTSSTITVGAWIGTAPAAGDHPFHLHLAHWRNNPHHWTAGEGFLYPSNEMQPGGHIAESTGLIYSRPRGRLTGSYVSRTVETHTADATMVASGLARLTTTASADLVASANGTTVALTHASSARSAVTGLVQFEDFLRPGHIVLLAGMNQSPSIDGFWRVFQLNTSAGITGSAILMVPLDPTTVVPGSVTGTVPAGATVTRLIWQPTYRFGSLIETAWRMAAALGRRVIVSHLGINGSSQVLASTNNTVAPQGKIGWWDDDTGFDWTPSNPNGLAARLRRLIEFIALRAVRATLGADRTLKVVAADIWQAETDATTAAGRALARQTIPTFVGWLRQVIEAAGLSPYRSRARIPVHWAQITAFPWETAGLGGDTEGLVNAAIDRFVAIDGGFAASYDPEGQPKLDGLHYNGVGEANNGREVADRLVSLIRFASSFALGPGAVQVANEALSLLGDANNVTALEPPNQTQQARLAVLHLPSARDTVLQAHAWTFATMRCAPVALGQDVSPAVSTWGYAYALPADMLHPLAVLPEDASDDLQVRGTALPYDPWTRLPVTPTSLATQPFTIEIDAEGNRVLRTNQQSPVLIYIARNVDMRTWDPSARQGLVHYLAHLLAGPTLKGKTGVQVAQGFLQSAEALLQRAAGRNAQYQRDVRLTPTCDWLP